MKNKVLQDYQSNEIQEAVGGADPHRLIQMLIDGALDRMARARGMIMRGEIAAKGEELGSAISIIGGLQESLDLEQGGEIAKNLNFLYEHMKQRLLLANLNNDHQIVEQVMGILKTIKSAWDEIREEALAIFQQASNNVIVPPQQPQEIENV